MADGTGGGEPTKITLRETNERAGIGLLSRFLGAVFLVLLCGLLLLDRALLRANESQARLDAQSAALLLESYLSARSVLLDRIDERLRVRQLPKDTLAARDALRALLASAPEVQRVWLVDSAGVSAFSYDAPNGREPIAGDLAARLDAQRSTRDLGLLVTQRAGGSALVSLVKEGRDTRGSAGRTVGLAFDGRHLHAFLDRARADTRAVLTVTSGNDTIAVLGQPEASTQALTATTRVARLPSGGTWSVTSTHALTTRSLRWAIWALGILGALFLAYGLLREQQRAIQATSRSLELERLYRDVKRANQAKSEFLANISHELRTPLNAIVGFVELLREGFYGDLALRQVPPVDRIAASANHLRHLVDQVLDIAKIAAGRMEVQAEPVVLRPFVLNVASELESLLNERKLAMSITVGASLPRVRTDPAHLRQILVNLIANAVKFTTTGTVSVRARLVQLDEVAGILPGDAEIRGDNGDARPSGGRTGAWVAIQVVDTGIGISAADRDRIFDEFEQVNAGPRGDSMQRGTGLGLPISRRLARLLGGDITVDSEPGRGSTFTIWLPVNAADITRMLEGETPQGTDAISA